MATAVWFENSKMHVNAFLLHFIFISFLSLWRCNLMTHPLSSVEMWLQCSAAVVMEFSMVLLSDTIKVRWVCRCQFEEYLGEHQFSSAHKRGITTGDRNILERVAILKVHNLFLTQISTFKYFNKLTSADYYQSTHRPDISIKWIVTQWPPGHWCLRGPHLA